MLYFQCVDGVAGIPVWKAGAESRVGRSGKEGKVGYLPFRSRPLLTPVGRGLGSIYFLKLCEEKAVCFLRLLFPCASSGGKVCVCGETSVISPTNCNLTKKQTIMKAILFSCAAAALLCTSCVTKEKYMLAENGRLEALARADRLNSELNVKRTENAQLSDRLAALCRDTTRLNRYTYRFLPAVAGRQCGCRKRSSQPMLNKKMQQLAERENTINELQDMITAQQEKVKSLLSSVKDALLGFNSDELTIREENGKVYVAMSDKLLFASGSATVDKRGKEALAKLAEVLNKQTQYRRLYRGTHRHEAYPQRPFRGQLGLERHPRHVRRAYPHGRIWRQPVANPALWPRRAHACRR